MHIIGAQGDANELAGHLPSQVAKTARALIGEDSGRMAHDVMAMVGRTLRRSPGVPGSIIKNQNTSTGRRFKLWKSRETGDVIMVWAARGFVHMENTSSGAYKKWTRRDALHLMDAMGQQAEVTKWPDEKQMARDAYLVLRDVCMEARAQGDPMEMTDEEHRSLKESIVCATLPGYGDVIRPKTVSFVGPRVSPTSEINLTSGQPKKVIIQ